MKREDLNKNESIRWYNMDDLDKYEEIICIISRVLKNGNAFIFFERNGCTLRIDDKIAEDALRKYKDEGKKIIEEILSQLPLALNDKINVNDQLTARKLNLIRTNILNDDLYRAYYLMREAVAPILKYIHMIPIIKPINNKRAKNLVTGVIMLRLSDEQNENNIQFEITSNQLQKIIERLNKFNDQLKELEKENDIQKNGVTIND